MVEIFDEPPVTAKLDCVNFTGTFERLSLQQLLDMLRARINNVYMPSSNGDVDWNSKPQLIAEHFTNPQYPDFPLIHMAEGTSFFSFPSLRGKGPVFVNVNAGGFQIIINLRTDEAILRKVGSNPYARFIHWIDAPSTRISIDISQLIHNLDNHL